MSATAAPDFSSCARSTVKAERAETAAEGVGEGWVRTVRYRAAVK